MIRNRVIRLGLIAGLLFTTGCGDEYTTRVQVFPDGSVVREVVLEDKNQKAPDDWWPFAVGSDWPATTTKTEKLNQGKKEVVYLHSVSRRFASGRQLRSEMESLPRDGSVLAPQVELTRRWRGFFFTFSYREAYPILPMFQRVPAGEFFAPAELDLVRLLIYDEVTAKQRYAKDEIDRVEGKFLQWQMRCEFEEIFHFLSGLAAKGVDPNLTTAMLREKREPLWQALQAEEDPSLAMHLKRFAEILPAELLDSLRQRAAQEFQALEMRFRLVEDHILDSFHLQVSLPGLITATNSTAVKGSRVSWDVPLLAFCFFGKEMTVESRCLNWWAVGGAAFLLCLLLLGLFIAAWRRKAMTSSSASRP